MFRQQTDAYKGILAAAKGSTGEKKLAAGFISRFYRHFPALADTAMDAMLDMIEDEDAQVRHGGMYMWLPWLLYTVTMVTTCTFRWLLCTPTLYLT